MSFRHVTMKVNGEEVSVDIDKELGVGDLSDDMDKVAAQMGFWGSVWAAAESEKELVDAHYRSWRAKLGEKMCAGEKSPPEWKAKQAIEGDDKFLQYKQAIATAIANATRARSMYDSYRAKASILQSKGAMSRAMMEAGGMATRSSRDGDSAEDRERKKSAMRAINEKKRAKTKIEVDSDA